MRLRITGEINISEHILKSYRILYQNNIIEFIILVERNIYLTHPAFSHNKLNNDEI